MKLIAITQRVDEIAAYGERRDALDQQWIELLASCGLTPLILPNRLPVVQQLLWSVPIDGIVLTGGNDLVKYGGNAPERDEVEKHLISYAIDHRIPLLGVCRGMQMIQDYFSVPLVEVEGHIASIHTIKSARGCAKRNSFHRFGARHSVKELIVLATSEDGVIEAVEHRTTKLRGIMWHPERANGGGLEDRQWIRDWLWNGR
ncbi:gamma-glutamyl-gamma-aminobutyrate hydrolase family protein [Paenibacillus xylaniclasticus]|uniref:gamma-glutamyl-gamma-aminobutyrate hydrolase family protein n=1 Tax=Paenibacillus xylaniclasticus TaxID=588083 RepID=UPI000FD79037|nr:MULTISPECIES: gamma-glutamyl-gamma-aminobutyrate hydrolase family protein [Paenibacillus]GFN30750.1 gamma-glutamyl-gamma-aminobutyrate hydrolase [Paenibacillus curdlanolyticus]